MGTGAAQVERTVRGVLPDLGRLPISLDLRAISIAEGIRAALSVAVIIALREYLDIPEMSEAALASLLTCLCDAGGPIRRRVPALLSFTLIGAAVTASFGMMRVFGMGVALPLGILALFCTSFARIYGQSPQQVGALISTVVILALDRPMAPAQAGVLAAFFLLGGVWATLLTMVIWQVHPYGPARRGVAEAYRRLSLLTADLRSLLLAAPGDAVWEAHARDHRGGVREAIEAARGIVMETLRTRGAASARAEQSLIRLETADQIFNALIALSDLTEHAGSRERAAVEPLLRRLRPLLAAMGRAIVTDTPQNVPQIGRSIDALAAAAAALPEGDRVEVDRVRAIFDRIVERLRIAQTLAAPENFLSDAGAPGQRPPLWQRVRQPLVANLTWGSPALRHALRTAAVAGEALALTMLWYSPYGHWLTITICATLQPYYALTLTRAVERVGGTALGGLGAGLVGLVCTTPLATALAMFPLAVLALSVRAVNHGLFMVMLTPLIVLLVDVGTSDASEWTVATVRAADAAGRRGGGRQHVPALADLGARAALERTARGDRRPRALRRGRTGLPAWCVAGQRGRAGAARCRRGHQRAGGDDQPGPAGAGRRGPRRTAGGDGDRRRAAPLCRTAIGDAARSAAARGRSGGGLARLARLDRRRDADAGGRPDRPAASAELARDRIARPDRPSGGADGRHAAACLRLTAACRSGLPRSPRSPRSRTVASLIGISSILQPGRR